MTWLVCWLTLACLVVPANADPAATSWTRFSAFDYRDTVWWPIRDFLAGGLPWQSEAYLARHPSIQPYLLYAPSYWWFLGAFALLPYQASVGLWLGITTASFVWLVYRGLAGCRGPLARPDALPVVCLVLLTTRPVKSALFQGQLALPCALGVVLAVEWVARERRSTAATMVALVKPPVGIPLLLVHCLTGQARTAIRALLATIALCLPIAGVVVLRSGGVGRALSIAQASLRQGSGTGLGGAFTYVDVRGLYGFLIGDAPAWTQAVAIALGCLLTLPLVRTTRLRRRPVQLDAGRALLSAKEVRSPTNDGRSRPWCHLLAVGLACVLITPNMLYALVVLIPGMLVLVDRVLGMRSAAERGIRLLLAGVGGLLLVPIFAPQGAFALVGLDEVGGNALNALCVAAAAALLGLAWWIDPLALSRPPESLDDPMRG